MQTPAVKKRKRSSRQPLSLSSLDKQAIQLRQIERRLDDLFRQLVDDLDDEEMARACEQLDVLVSTFPDLRLSNLGPHLGKVQDLLSRLDPETGPLPGFHKSMEQLCELCVTPQAIHQLRSSLHAVAARVAETCPELLPTVAIAALSLSAPDRAQMVFMEMVACASAIECLIASRLDGNGSLLLEVGGWLAAEPSDALIAALGEGQAYYYASIPGVLLLLDQDVVLFDANRLAPYVRTLPHGNGRYSEHVLNELVDRGYRCLLRDQIARVQGALHWQQPASAMADVAMLTERALEALDELPPQANPLLQAIFVQSLVRFFDQAC